MLHTIITLNVTCRYVIKKKIIKILYFKYFTVNTVNVELFLKFLFPAWNTYTRHLFRSIFLWQSQDAGGLKCNKLHSLYPLGNINQPDSCCYLASHRQCRWPRWCMLLPSIPVGKAQLNSHKIQHHWVHQEATAQGCWWRETCLPSTNRTRWFSSVQPMESKFWARNKGAGQI